MFLEEGAGRRKELADFLRTRRERKRPVEVGLAGGVRRRTPGLRREEVALLANIGVTWYTRLEQGQPINASLDVLERIADALRMSPAEREHLCILGGYAPKPAALVEEQPSAAILNLLEVLDPNPAMCLNRVWDVVAWNRAAVALFGDFGTFEPRRRNMVWRFFMDPQQRTVMPRWADVSCNLVAQFRANAARYPDDPRFVELTEELLASSGEFRAEWARHDVGAYRDGHKHLYHPKIGNFSLEFTRLNIPTQSDLRVSIYMAKPGSREAQMLASLVAESRLTGEESPLQTLPRDLQPAHSLRAR